MALTAKEKNGADLEPIPAGVYVATCYGLVDLGTHPNPTFGNESHKVLVQWEVPEVRGEFERDGQRVSLPRAISKRYTLSLSEKANLRKDLESWRARRFTAEELGGFDLRALLGTACQLQIVHETSKEGRTYASIAAIMALPRGTPRPKPENPTAFFSFEEAGDKPALPPGLPEWVTKIIMESKEWKMSLNGKPVPAAPVPRSPILASTEAEAEGDEVPF
jgi:hypothetical protein